MSRSGRSGRVRREPVPVPVRPFVYTHATKNAGSRAKDIFAQKVTFVWEKPILAIESRASSRVVARAPLCPRCPRPGKSSTDRLCVRARAPSSVSSNSPTHDASTRRDNQSNESRDFSPHLHRAAPSSRRSRSRSRSPARRPRRPSLRPRASRRSRARDRSIVARVRPSRRRVPTRQSAGAPVASERKPGVPAGDAVATLIIPVTFPHSTRRERHERTHARRRTPTPRIASSPATRAFVSARVRRRGRVSVVSARRGAASTNRRFVGVSARQRASERGVRRALTRTLVDDARADRGAS